MIPHMARSSELVIHAEGEVKRATKPHPTNGKPCPTCGKTHVDARTEQEKKAWPSD